MASSTVASAGKAWTVSTIFCFKFGVAMTWQSYHGPDLRPSA
jgi:hypothetical protein